METLSDLRKYILSNYGIQPHVSNDDELTYRAITFHVKLHQVLVSMILETCGQLDATAKQKIL